MHPTNERFSAILAGSGTSLGFMTFQAAKLQSPLDKFKHRRPKTIQLSDETVVAGVQWRSLKHQAMASHYKQKSWYKNLNSEELHLLEALRTAQYNQGNLNDLEVQPYY